MVWASLLLGVATWLGPVATPASGLVGATRCKLCHRQVYESWATTRHARTDRLPAGSDASCRACHSTSAAAGLLGVQCESCHGAGAAYSPAEVMIDRDKALLAGLVLPDESVCRGCHAAGAPDHQREFSMPDPGTEPSAIHRMAPP